MIDGRRQAAQISSRTYGTKSAKAIVALARLWSMGNDKAMPDRVKACAVFNECFGNP